MKALRSGNTVVVLMTIDEAANISHRLNCSSFKTFDQYRKDNGLGGLNRNPLAKDFSKGIGS